MFNFFKKPTMMDGAIHAIYGPNPPRKSADVQRATNLAAGLLGNRVDFREVQTLAEQLYAGPMPYSTHDLAVSMALAFFHRVDLMQHLAEMQLPARMQVLDWFKAGYVNPHFARNFEDTLYEDYKPFVEAATAKAPMSKAQAKYTNEVRYYIRYIFLKEHWEAFDEARMSDFQLALMKGGKSPKAAAMLCACAFCGVKLEAEKLSDRDIEHTNEIGNAADEAEARIADYEGYNTSLKDDQFALWNATLSAVRKEHGFDLGEMADRRITVVGKIKIFMTISKTEIAYHGRQIVISVPLFFVRPDAERTELLAEAIQKATALDPDTDDFLMNHELV
jgi:hypothetical protein